MAAPCPTCGAPLETPLCCTACGGLLEFEGSPDPFEVLGVPREFAVDPARLKQRLRELSRRMHPDFFGTADGDLRALAEKNTATLNDAYEELSDDRRRADGLVRRLGGPDEVAERQMPQEFLMEVLEWNESLEDERSQPSSALATLEAELEQRRTSTLQAVANLLTPLPAPGASQLTDVRQLLNALRYLQKTLSEIGALRLEQANSR